MSLFNSIGNQNKNIIQQYREFRQMFKGDPAKVIQQKLQSGEITQQQIEQAKAMMSQFSQLLK